jgi:hypothetical protein
MPEEGQGGKLGILAERILTNQRHTRVVDTPELPLD